MPARTFTLTLSESVFAEVKDTLQYGAQPMREFSDDETVAFLTRHPNILGNIIRFDEVDTTDRELIWQAQRDEAADAVSR